jgi:hypothetical protein
LDQQQNEVSNHSYREKATGNGVQGIVV